MPDNWGDFEPIEDLPPWQDEPFEHAKPNGYAKRRDKTFFTAAELGHTYFPPIKFVVPGYIAEGITLVAGKPKFGKSWLVMHAAIAVARGQIHA
jgi:hypothetical protein